MEAEPRMRTGRAGGELRTKLRSAERLRDLMRFDEGAAPDALLAREPDAVFDVSSGAAAHGCAHACNRAGRVWRQWKAQLRIAPCGVVLIESRHSVRRHVGGDVIPRVVARQK